MIAVPHRRQEGFTLLELVVAVLLIALAVAVSYPSLTRGSAALQLRANGRDVLNILRYAREKAITEQKEMQVTCDPTTHRIVMSDVAGEDARARDLPEGVKLTRLVLAGEEIREGPLVIRFLPNGSSQNAELTLTSKTGASLRIVTDPVTGGARVVSGSGEHVP